MSEFKEVLLISERLTLKRIHPDLHAAEVNVVVTDSFDTLGEWLPWSINTPSIEVRTCS